MHVQYGTVDTKIQSTWVTESTYIYLALFSLTRQPGPNLAPSSFLPFRRPSVRKGAYFECFQSQDQRFLGGAPRLKSAPWTLLEWGPHGPGQPVNTDLEELALLRRDGGGPGAKKILGKGQRRFWKLATWAKSAALIAISPSRNWRGLLLILLLLLPPFNRMSFSFSRSPLFGLLGCYVPYPVQAVRFELWPFNLPLRVREPVTP